jgi:hypothetical protein
VVENNGKNYIDHKRGEYIELAPIKYQNKLRKAYEGKSKVTALNAKCLDCSCYQVREVRECTVICCPLYEVRPYQ